MSQTIIGVNNYTDPDGTRNSLEDFSIIQRALLLKEGVIAGIEVTETSPASTNIAISKGYLAIKCGDAEFLVYRLKDDIASLAVPNTGSAKYYLVVMKVDLTNVTVAFEVVEGTTGTDPDLTEGGSPEVYYIPIARIEHTGGSTISNSEIVYLGDTNNSTVEEIRSIVGVQRKEIQMPVINFASDVIIGDGAYYFEIEEVLDGMELVSIYTRVITAGTTGTTDVQIQNVTDTVDMLSTVVTIDSGDDTSRDAATPPVIDTTNNVVATGDLLRVDIDAVSTTPPEGLLVTLVFQRPGSA